MEKRNEIEMKIEKILETIVEDLSKDDLGLMEVQAMQSKLNVMSAALQLSRKIHDKADVSRG